MKRRDFCSSLKEGKERENKKTNMGEERGGSLPLIVKGTRRYGCEFKTSWKKKKKKKKKRELCLIGRT